MEKFYPACGRRAIARLTSQLLQLASPHAQRCASADRLRRIALQRDAARRLVQLLAAALDRQVRLALADPAHRAGSCSFVPAVRC